jgi:hypothetical protein
MSASCDLIGRNEQETIKNYAEWSTGWLKTVSYDLMLTMQKLKTIYIGEHSNQSDSVEYNALCELIGSLYDQLKQKYYDNECEKVKYDDLYFILKNIHNSTIKIKDELNNNKPIEIKKNILIKCDKPESYKINIPGSYWYYLRYSNVNNSRNESIFFEIDKYIHDYFGDVENPFETEFSLIFNDVDVVKYLNGCVLKDVIYSSKNPILKKLDSICRNDDNSGIVVHCQVSVLENLKFNYPKIKFEYNENVTKEFVLSENDCLKNKTVKLLD